MNILGVAAFYHDSAACLVRNGRIIAAAQEERFNRQKNTGVFPIEALNYCTQAGDVLPTDVDYLAYFEKPYLKFARVMLDHLYAWPRSAPSFLRKMPAWLEERLSFDDLVERELGYSGKILYVPHHLSHAASAFFPSAFEEAAILTVDGVGEWSTLTTGRGRDTQLHIAREIRYPNSLGLLYTTVTAFLGFGAHGEEGKVMALAALGEPSFQKEFAEIFRQAPDGSFWLNPKYFSYRGGTRMWSHAWEGAFGPPRRADDPLTERDRNLAATVQVLLEGALVGIARGLQAETGLDRLVMAGGVALNCLANSKILERAGFRDVFVQPAAGDAGGALGAALYAQHCLLGGPRGVPMQSAALGPEFSDREIERALRLSGLPYRRLAGEEELCREAARTLAAGGILGWFQGRLEFGPRALGQRSILAHPGSADTRHKLNAKIKNREAFQPFGPMVLAERAPDVFCLAGDSPFMLFAPRVREEWRERIPAAVHADGTSRVQTVKRDSQPMLHRLLSEFQAATGLPALLNTSFNRRGEPIVCRPAEAIECFQETGLDALAMGDFWVDG